MGELAEEFMVNRGLKQGDRLSTLLFSMVLEKIIWHLLRNVVGKIMNRLVQCVAYADDIVFVARHRRILEETFVTFETTSGDLELRSYSGQYRVCGNDEK